MISDANLWGFTEKHQIYFVFIYLTFCSHLESQKSLLIFFLFWHHYKLYFLGNFGSLAHKKRKNLPGSPILVLQIYHPKNPP